MGEWEPIVFALVAYALLLAFAIARRVGADPNPLKKLHSWHLVGAVAYVAFALEYGATATGALVGLYVYFAIHYAIVVQFFELGRRSVSANILALLGERGGEAPLAAIREAYAPAGGGFRYVRTSRLEFAVRAGFLRVAEGGRYALTRFGAACDAITEALLRIFNLRRIGGAE